MDTIEPVSSPAAVACWPPSPSSPPASMMQKSERVQQQDCLKIGLAQIFLQQLPRAGHHLLRLAQLLNLQGSLCCHAFSRPVCPTPHMACCWTQPGPATGLSLEGCARLCAGWLAGWFVLAQARRGNEGGPRWRTAPEQLASVSPADRNSQARPKEPRNRISAFCSSGSLAMDSSTCDLTCTDGQMAQLDCLCSHPNHSANAVVEEQRVHVMAKHRERF